MSNDFLYLPKSQPRVRNCSKVDRKWVREAPKSPSPRPNSRASSSSKSTVEEDLLDKAEKLLRDVQEIQQKPIKTHQILREAGSETGAGGSTTMRQPTVSNAEEVQTTMIRVPRGEINNKSPLPFAYDNFSTLGIRGNIASVGAAEPETPYPPIFPTIVKTSPSPVNNKRY